MGKITDSVWEKNKLIWWKIHKKDKGELHHIFGRVGVFKACIRFFYPAEYLHHRDYEWIKELRDIYLNDKKLAEANYVKGLGCKDKIFIECEVCKMPIIT